MSLLPTVVDSSGKLAHTSEKIFGASVPIAGIAGDQQSALFGQLCFEPGEAKNTYGTGCFAVTNTGKTIVNSTNQMLSTVAWQLNGELTYALEGTVYIAGALVQWLRDGLKIIENSSDIEALNDRIRALMRHNDALTDSIQSKSQEVVGLRDSIDELKDNQCQQKICVFAIIFL